MMTVPSTTTARRGVPVMRLTLSFMQLYYRPQIGPGRSPGGPSTAAARPPDRDVLEVNVNVSVEHLNYEPTRRSEIRWLTRQRMEGRTVPGRKATIETELSRPMVGASGRTELVARGGMGRNHLARTIQCAVTRRHSSAGANPARQLSFQPVAVGADDGGNDIG